MFLDLSLFDIINGLAGRFPWLDALGKVFAVFGLLAVVLIALAVIFWRAAPEERRRSFIMPALAGLGCALIFALEWLITTHLLHHELRSRPVNGHWVTLLISANSRDAFPAWPALITFAVSLPLVRVKRTAGIVALFLSLLTGLSLVFVGINFPADVLTGALLGISIGLTACSLIEGQPSRRSVILLWLITCLWGGMLAVTFSPASAGEGNPSTSRSKASVMVSPPAVVTKHLTVLASPGKVQITAAGNGHLLVASIKIIAADPNLPLEKVQSLARRVVNVSFANWPALGLVTVEVAGEFQEGSRLRVGTLYTATVDREQCPAGGFRNDQSLPGKKFYHARYY